MSNTYPLAQDQTAVVEVVADPTDVVVITSQEIVAVADVGIPGPVGPTGPAGISQTISYVHNQNSSSDTWVITHNLGWFPNVTVVDSGGTNVEGDVQYDSENQITLNFSAGFSGIAYLS